MNSIEAHDILAQPTRNTWILLLNNLNLFTDNPERADAFDGLVLQAGILFSKMRYMPDLLPGTLKGEQEFLVNDAPRPASERDKTRERAPRIPVGT